MSIEGREPQPLETQVASNEPVKERVVKTAVLAAFGLGVTKLVEAVAHGIKGNEREHYKSRNQGLGFIAAAVLITLIPGSNSARRAEMGRN